jgi:hypothetical protein
MQDCKSTYFSHVEIRRSLSQSGGRQGPEKAKKAAGRQPVKDGRGGKARFEGPLSLMGLCIIYGGHPPCDRQLAHALKLANTHP